MLISVIITNYNYAHFLGAAIDSVLNQTYREVECIVVDDGSTDNSQAVIESRPQVKAVFARNGGQAAAFRRGVTAARGEIIMSLDSDDYLFSDACEQIAANWKSGLSCINFRLSISGNSFSSCPSEKFVEDDHAAYLARFGYYPSAPMSGNAFSTRYLQQFLECAEHLDGDGVDAYLLYSAPFFGRVAHIDKELGFYRMHGRNVSMTSGRKTVKNLGDHAYYQFWAQQNAQRFARQKDGLYPQRDYLVGAYTALWLLVAKDGGYSNKPLPDQGRVLTTAVAMKSFATQPGIGLFKRIKNIGLLMALLLLPLVARLWLEERFILKIRRY